MFYTQFNRPEPQLEINSGELITETAGYIPAEIQIIEMINAGKRLNEHREEYYDFGPNDTIDETLRVPVREPNYDMADATEALHHLDAIKKSLKTEAKEKADKKAKDDDDTIEALKALKKEKQKEIWDKKDQEKIDNPEKKD